MPPFFKSPINFSCRLDFAISLNGLLYKHLSGLVKTFRLIHFLVRQEIKRWTPVSPTRSYLCNKRIVFFKVAVNGHIRCSAESYFATTESGSYLCVDSTSVIYQKKRYSKDRKGYIVIRKIFFKLLLIQCQR